MVAVLPSNVRRRFDFRGARWFPSSVGLHEKKGLSVESDRAKKLERFRSEVYGQVEGWLGDRMWQIVSILGTILDANGVRGNIAEFGVHHGLFLFLLSAIRNDDEQCFAVDVLDDQKLNIDSSGGGSLATFLAHIETFMATERQFFKIVQRDTISFSIAEVIELFGRSGVKFFSVDAGHTVQHTCNDLSLVPEVLAPGGIVALDDYMSVHWPGVTEGFYRYMNYRNRRLTPFLCFQNKIISHHGFRARLLFAAVSNSD